MYIKINYLMLAIYHMVPWYNMHDFPVLYALYINRNS
jgi:hypothetical protein